MLLLPDREILIGRIKRREICGKGCWTAFLGTCVCLLLYCFGILEAFALYEAGVGALVSAGLFWSWKRLRIESRMLPECFIRLEEERIIIRQVHLSGGTEVCRAEYRHIKKMIPAKGRRPAFYIELAENQAGAGESFIREGNRTGRKIFLARSDGYRCQEFIRVYRMLCQILPKEAQSENVREPEQWQVHPLDIGGIGLCLIPVFYLIPVVVLAI